MLFKNLNILTNGYNFLLSLLLLCSEIVAGGNVRINNVGDFKSFANKVNTGTDDFNELTVLLDADLSLSGESFQPIGNYTSTNYFRGVFDGQGHIISDLKIDSTSAYTGLFGYSKGLTIRNVVLDSSCSIISSYSGSYGVRVGGIIGGCSARYGQCNIENSVNMADVTFSGDNSNGYSLYLGGFVGYFYSYSYPSYVKNCANYGSVTHSGASGNSNIGGVVGYLDGSSSNYAYAYNSINYGTITHSATTSSTLRLGGIAGYSNHASIENCVSAGKISSKTSYIGSIVGYIDSYTYINYCYLTSELNEYKIYGYAYSTPRLSKALSYDNTTLELNEPVSVGNYTGASLVDSLNAAADYYFLRDYSKWLLNKEKKNVNFTIGRRTTPITMNYQIILLPSLASEGSLMFDGWYNDDECTNPLESFEVTEDTSLYGRFEENTNNYTITFDTRKEYTYFAPITSQFGATVSLPSKFVEGQCGVAFWETEYGDDLGLNLAMPAYNFTLYAVWKCTHLVTPGDFIEFANKVNSGNDDFNGITVLLDSDLSFFNKTLKPIGEDYYNCFHGVFDGQGHIISDLKMNSSSSYTGLFGYSKGLTIRNVVLDSSCSITNSYSDSLDIYVGGIIGYCESYKKECIIENNVNMADVTLNGNIDNYYYLFLGGIAGWLSSYSSGYPSYVKNCANYGSVTYSGTRSFLEIGGIIGELEGSYIYKYVQNCINYGAIIHNGTTSNFLYLGGIAGESDSAYIENCVSAGKIITPSYSSYIGGIVGYVYSKTFINNSFWTGDAGEYPINGYGSPIIDDETSQAEVNMTLVNKLNSYAPKSNNWNKWLLNTNNAPTTFKVNNNAGIIVNSQIILLPDLVDNDERNFKGWYTDATLTSLFTDNKVNAETTLYGMFCGSSNYTVTFDANGGNDLSEGEDKVVAFNNTYGTLPEAEKPGYVFMGWFTEKTNGTKVTSKTIVTIPNNHTLYAHWEEITNYVKVVFSTKGLTKSEAEEILKQYTRAEFTIVKYEINELGETIVTIKFTSKEDAEKFVGAINELGENGDIKANFVFSNDESFSSKLYPTLLTIVMLLL